MEPATVDLQSLAERVKTLERQNRLFKRGAVVSLVVVVVLLLVCAGLVTMAQIKPAQRAKKAEAQEPAQSVEAEQFILKDSSGVKRAELSMDAGDASLQFFDQEGGQTSFISDGFIFLQEPGNDKAGAVSLGMFGKKEAPEPMVEVDGTDDFSAILGAADTVTIRTGEHHTTSAASLTLLGKDHKVLWSAP